MNKLTLLGVAAAAALWSAAGSASAQVPFYRFDNVHSKDQLLTTNASEVAGKNDWAAKGVIGYVYTQPSTGLVTLYRYYNASVGDYFYTTNYNELRDGNFGWERQRDAGFVYAEQRSGTIPLYRYANGRGDHYYTTDYNELRGGNGEWRSEGITAYILPPGRSGSSNPPDLPGGPSVIGVNPGGSSNSGPSVSVGPRSSSSGSGPSVTREVR